MSKILITGATGFIGNKLVRELKRRHEVYGLARQLPSKNTLQGVQWIRQDLAEPLDYSNLPEHVDAIVHLAQSRFYKQFPYKAKDIYSVNIHGTFQLLEYARNAGTDHFIFTSSGGVYGYGYEKFVETDRVNLLNFYLSSKYAAELLIANYQLFFHTIVFRLFFAYGPGQKDMLIPTLLSKVRKGETIVIEGNPGIQINPIYIEDAIRVFEPALQLSQSMLFNVAGNEVITVTDLVKLMEEVSGGKAQTTHTDVTMSGDLIGDNSQMKEVLGVHPRVSLFEGLKTITKQLG